MEYLKEFIEDLIVISNEYCFFPYENIFSYIAFIRFKFNYICFDMLSVYDYIKSYIRNR